MVEYRFEPKFNKSTAYVDGTQIGECDYTIKDNTWYITHTEVNPEFGGQGIARQLVNMVVSEAQDQGADLVPICSYAVKVLSK